MNNKNFFFWPGVFASQLMINSVVIAAQPLDLSTDNLSFVEEPMAFEVAEFTVLINALLELSSSRDQDTEATDNRLSGAVQISAERQLSNAITIGATYLGEEDGEFEDEIVAYGRGTWGGLAVGNVSKLVENATERMDGTGKADLTLDNFLGGLSENGIGYFGRFSAYTLNAVIDEDNNLDVGVTFERPLGNKDYRFTARLTDADLETIDGTDFDTKGIALVAELIYGSLLTDMAFGYEKLEAGSVSFDRQYLSAGAIYKQNRWSFSIEGHIGEIEDQDESGYSLGIRYDISRGLSANLGFNHTDSAINLVGIQLTDQDSNEIIFSIRYEF